MASPSSTTTSTDPSTMPTTASSKAVAASSGATYKGKTSGRGWQHLPEELIKLVVKHYVWDFNLHIPCTWDPREEWPSHIVFRTMRQARLVETIMAAIPSWQMALESCDVWDLANRTFDPNDVFAHNMWVHPPQPQQAHGGSAHTVPQPYQLSPYKHWRNLAHYSCWVCRVNNPNTSFGTGCANLFKRAYPATWFGHVPICRAHRRGAHASPAFCGVCLAQITRVDASVAPNEDEDQFGMIDATCRSCRAEKLWACIRHDPHLRAATGWSPMGTFDPAREPTLDWEIRQVIEGYVDTGEGTISEAVCITIDKHWLQMHTKLRDMLQQALAASRLQRAEEEPALEDEDELSDDEDDWELMQLTEDSGVRELALGDWARHRILDGLWLSPADQYYGSNPRPVRATHPLPWEEKALPADAPADATLVDHPRPATLSTPHPPSFSLCNQAFSAYGRAFRELLFPALQNLVRRLVIEAAADGADPALRASRMGMEDVLRVLREDAGVWYNGFDWLERRAHEHAAREPPSPGSSAGSGSSHGTSPVLSTTTLQTTPSPPPKAEHEPDAQAVQTATAIPVSPVLDVPKMVSPVPFVPESCAGMPSYSMEAFKNAWREACRPLYHCKCTICERAMAASAGAPAPAPAPHRDRDREKERLEAQREQEQLDAELDAAFNAAETPRVVRLQPARPGDREELELAYDESLFVLSSDDDEDMVADIHVDVDGESNVGSHYEEGYVPPSSAPVAPKLRKRSSDEIEDGGAECERKKKMRVGDGWVVAEVVRAESPSPAATTDAAAAAG